MPMSVVEQYCQMIEHLDKADKIILAEKIMNSVLISKDEKLTCHYKNCVW